MYPQNRVLRSFALLQTTRLVSHKLNWTIDNNLELLASLKNRGKSLVNEECNKYAEHSFYKCKWHIKDYKAL